MGWLKSLAFISLMTLVLAETPNVLVRQALIRQPLIKLAVQPEIAAEPVAVAESADTAEADVVAPVAAVAAAAPILPYVGAPQYWPGYGAGPQNWYGGWDAPAPIWGGYRGGYRRGYRRGYRPVNRRNWRTFGGPYWRPRRVPAVETSTTAAVVEEQKPEAETVVDAEVAEAV